MNFFSFHTPFSPFIEALCEPRALGATISMLLGEGTGPCCTLTAQKYADLHKYYRGFLEERSKKEEGEKTG